MDNLQSLDQLISLKGKHALVTGAAAGIGKAIAYRLAEAGAPSSLRQKRRWPSFYEPSGMTEGAVKQ